MRISTHPLATIRGADAAFVGPIDAQLAARLRASMSRMLADPGALTGAFYDKLFGMMPELRHLFPQDMTAQKLKLTEMLNWIVQNLDRPAEVRQQARDMGRRHLDYGTKPEHYPLVCQCLLAAMESVSGDGWNKEIAADWTSALELLSALMITGAARASSGPSP